MAVAVAVVVVLAVRTSVGHEEHCPSSPPAQDRIGVFDCGLAPAAGNFHTARPSASPVLFIFGLERNSLGSKNMPATGLHSAMNVRTGVLKVRKLEIG